MIELTFSFSKISKPLKLDLSNTSYGFKVHHQLSMYVLPLLVIPTPSPRMSPGSPPGQRTWTTPWGNETVDSVQAQICRDKLLCGQAWRWLYASDVTPCRTSCVCVWGGGAKSVDSVCGITNTTVSCDCHVTHSCRSSISVYSHQTIARSSTWRYWTLEAFSNMTLAWGEQHNHHQRTTSTKVM